VRCRGLVGGGDAIGLVDSFTALQFRATEPQQPFLFSALYGQRGRQ
jgi:hypothetical protein